jgi:hypothetical protein
MTPSLLRLCAALASIVSWTLVAPASPGPTGTTSAISEATHPPSASSAETAPRVALQEFAAPYLVSAVTAPELVGAAPADIVHPWRRLLKREVTPAVVAQANAIIRTRSVIGDEVPFIVAGERFLARIEEHYHPPGGDKFPWGPHPGVSVFVARPQPAP